MNIIGLISGIKFFINFRHDIILNDNDFTAT